LAIRLHGCGKHGSRAHLPKTIPTPYRNFSAIDPLLGCEEGKKDCPISLRQFLPYLYFSVVTTTTVGYGDISPRTLTATWLVIIHHLIAIALLIE